MKNKVSPNKNERGITLIALIVCVIILILLSAVVLRGITGKESLIKVSSEEVDTYNAKQYKEQIDTISENIILQYELEGKQITLRKLSEEMEEQTTWIKLAVANTDKDSSNEDAIITTTDGYVYQLYYNESYGQRYIEYIGTEDGKVIPNIITVYDKVSSNIEVIGSEGVALVELIYRDQVIDEIVGNTGTFNVDKTGWYIIRVTTREGKVRYAWERVSSTVETPKIEIKANGEAKEGWYSSKSNPVKAEITVAGEKAVRNILYTK